MADRVNSGLVAPLYTLAVVDCRGRSRHFTTRREVSLSGGPYSTTSIGRALKVTTVAEALIWADEHPEHVPVGMSLLPVGIPLHARP